MSTALAAPTGLVARFRAGTARVLAATRRSLRGHDLSLIAAGLTYFSGIAVVPSLLLAIRLGALLRSPEEITRLAANVADVLPDAMGAPAAVTGLVEAGVRLNWVGLLVAVFPASFYGEGLRRAFLRMAGPDDRTESFIGWRGRLAVLPLLAIVPLVLYGLLLVTPTLSVLSSEGGATATVTGVLVGFFSCWLLLAIPIGWVFAVVAPGRRLGRGAVVAGALGTSSFISGFLQGFVLFLSIPVDLGSPFGGLTVIGAFVAVGFWLFMLHLVVLVGYVITRSLDSQVFRREPAPGARRPVPGRPPGA